MPVIYKIGKKQNYLQLKTKIKQFCYSGNAILAIKN